MNFHRISQDNYQFPILDMHGWLDVKSQTSICLNLGKKEGNISYIMGRADVHHPCDGGTKAVVHISLPARYETLVSIPSLVETILDPLEIRKNETVRAQISFGGSGIAYTREGNGLIMSS